jgi:hypothetical protein
MTAAPAVSAGSQFKSVTEGNEFQLHLPFERGSVVQPFCESNDIRWPLSEADLHLFERESKAGNAHAQNNLGLLKTVRDPFLTTYSLSFDSPVRCGVFVRLVQAA